MSHGIGRREGVGGKPSVPRCGFVGRFIPYGVHGDWRLSAPLSAILSPRLEPGGEDGVNQRTTLIKHLVFIIWAGEGCSNTPLAAFFDAG